MASRFSICFSLFILAYCVTYSSAAVASWQEEFKMEIETKMNKIETKNAQIEGKVTQLETQLEFNNELRKDLTLKVTRLEAKVQEQETILNFLLQANELPISPTGSKLMENYRQNVIQSNGRSGIPRTCRELRATNPSFSSGMQWIDPDGQGIGDDPIFVFCDMSSGSTAILHDSELPIDVGHCTDLGCYSRAINYNASSKQMKTLAELSSECHQSIKYDCYYAPFKFDNVEYAWWNDRDGNAQNFWAGSNETGIHTCQCGIDGNCVDPAVKCNCDTLAPDAQLVDDGVITDKNVLPITRLNFGRTQLATSSGVHTLGRLVCSGSVALNGFPTSCEDLWLIGHTLNGFYSVKGEKMIESVYCDFTLLPSDANFQKWIGFNDVKSTPVHFYVQRNSSFSTYGTPIPFDLERVNEGNAMNLTSGKFTAPRPGIYFFSFTGLARFSASSSEVYLGIGLYLNGDRIGLGYVEEANTVANQDSPLIVQSTLNLTKDDQVWVEIFWQSTFIYLTDDSYHRTHFTGFMLEENIVASL